MGWSRADCAKFLHVTERCLHNWETGRHPVPFASLKLLRLHLGYELPGEAWRGWSISRGKLCTPEGHELDPQDAAWWMLLVRRAEVGTRALAELRRLRQQQSGSADGDADGQAERRTSAAAAAQPDAAGAQRPGPEPGAGGDVLVTRQRSLIPETRPEIRKPSNGAA